MLKESKKNAKAKPQKMNADAGYYSEANIELLKKEKIDSYIPPDKQHYNRIEIHPPRDEF